MPAKRKPFSEGPAVEVVIARLKALGTKADLEGMSRYAIPSEKAFGVAINKIQGLAKELGKNHELAEQLWGSGWYEARTLAAYVEDPAQVSAAQMDHWCRDFDNWAICDTVCFALFDRTPHAWKKVEQWATKKEEFQKRAAFALLWGLTVHDKQSGDAPFLKGLQLIERAATDERNFVKKAVDMALRATGKRNAALNVAAVETAQRLAKSADATACWIGKHAGKELVSPAVKKRIGK
jgi:3-methyladenine DNA glycosylase AlkD